MADPTARFESILERSEKTFERIMGGMEEVTPDRPIGSEPVSKEELLRDYVLVREDQTALTDRAQEFRRQHGFRKGILTFQQWIIDMEKQVA